ncbi:unnamed protein product [Urochloa humidicola]
MTSSKQDIALQEGTTFVFDSWVHVADGAGGFRRHLRPTKEKEALPSTMVDIVMLPDIVRGYELESSQTQTLPHVTLSKEDMTPLSSSTTLPLKPMFGHCRPLSIKTLLEF